MQAGQKDEMSTKNLKEIPKLRFELVSGVLEVDISDLEAIRRTTLDYLGNPGEKFRKYEDLRENFIHELKDVNCVIGPDGIARASGWMLERKSEATALMLVRRAPRTDVMIRFYAQLEKDRTGNWKVATFGHRTITTLR